MILRGDYREASRMLPSPKKKDCTCRVLYVHDSTWWLRRGFAYATVPQKRKIAPAGCCTYMILRGDYGEASRMLVSSKYSLYYYYDVRCTRPPPNPPAALEGDGGVLCTAHTTSPRSPPLLVGGVGDRDVLHTRCYVWINIYRYQHIRQP